MTFVHTNKEIICSFQKKDIKVSMYLVLKCLVVYGSLNPGVFNPFAICLAVRATIFILKLSLKIKLPTRFM